jgi:hypothetical protein
VANIQELTQDFIWKHVRSNENPADLNSRGISVEELKVSKLWWHGASFLLKNEEEWPTQPILKVKTPETKTILLAHSNKEPFQFKGTCSSYKTLLKAIILISRWAEKARNKTPTINKQVYTAQEYHNAERKIIRILQKGEYKKEYQAIHFRKPIANDSLLKNLNPIIIDGILRVGGRLINTNLPFDSKHPIILPRSHVSELIIRNAHEKTRHSGVSTTLYKIREKYWIVRGRNYVKNVIKNCVICAKNNPMLGSQIMGNLPAERTTISPPFYITQV